MYGAEAVILDLSRCLRRSGHRSVLGVFANSARPNTELEMRARSEGLEIHPIACRGQLDLNVASSIRSLVQRTGADVVHSHGYKADIYARWAMRGSRTPLVATCHNWIDNNLTLRLYGKLDRAALRRFDGTIAVSEGVRQRLLSSGVNPDRIALIRNGVDLHPFKDLRRLTSFDVHRPLRVGLVARLSHEKGVDLFLRAAAIALKAQPNALFVVAGDGPDRPALEALIRELGLQQHLTLLGRQENMPAFYASLDVLVLSSRIEGLPMALLEGMASGLPVVATAVGEVPQVIENGRSGRIVAPGNYEALAAAIIQILEDGRLRQSFGINAMNRVADQFSAAKMTAEYVRLYSSLTRKSQ
jgi:glycosyltransferase involved in cell wall biosynthesis